MWVRRMTAVCPKCSGKIKKNGGGELRCVDCGIKVGIQEVTEIDDTLCYEITEIVEKKKGVIKLEPASKS